MIENVLSSTYKYFKEASDKLKTIISSNQSKLSDLARTNLDLGLYHLREGNLNDAILRFRLVLLLDKNNIHALYNLARAYLAKDERIKSSNYIDKCLKLSPNNVEAIFFKRMFDKKTQVKEVPLSIIKTYYDSFAENYDAEFDVNRGYFAPLDLVELLAKHKKTPQNVLDLGSGTGTVGFILKEKFPTANLTGVEASDKMINVLQERQKDIKSKYNLIIENDVWEFLLKTKKKFDVIVANLSFHYNSDIQKSLKIAKQCLEPNGIIVFSVEKSPSGEETTLNIGSENFSFSQKFLKQEIENSTLQLLECTETSIKNDRMALICACQKS